jgi:hypothetical protein
MMFAFKELSLQDQYSDILSKLYNDAVNVETI